MRGSKEQGGGQLYFYSLLPTTYYNLLTTYQVAMARSAGDCSSTYYYLLQPTTYYVPGGDGEERGGL